MTADKQLLRQLQSRVHLARSSLLFEESNVLLDKALQPEQDWFTDAARSVDGCVFFAHQSRDLHLTNVVRTMIAERVKNQFIGHENKWYFLCNELRKGGDYYDGYVGLAICLCNCVVLTASSNCINSYYVPLEVDIALSLATPILIVKGDISNIGDIHPMLLKSNSKHLTNPVGLAAHESYRQHRIYKFEIGELLQNPSDFFYMLCMPHVRPKAFGGSGKLNQVPANDPCRNTQIPPYVV